MYGTDYGFEDHTRTYSRIRMPKTVDEGHRLKNHRCTILSSLKRLKAANRLLLTGTPIQNTLNERKSCQELRLCMRMIVHGIDSRLPSFASTSLEFVEFCQSANL